MIQNIFTSLGFHPISETWFKAQFAAPSPPQEHGWPSIVAGKHTLILAPTGSGKTLAAFLWSIDKLFRNATEADTRGFSKNTPGIHTLYISPLKALNNDIHRNLQAPLGVRANGAWAVALAAVVEKHWQTTIQYSFDDDGIMMRLPDVIEPPPIGKLFKLSPEEIKKNLIAALAANPIFAVQFRYNAARALLLPRSQLKKRIPLWLQRLRAARDGRSRFGEL